MKQARIDADVSDLDVTVTKDRTRGNGASLGNRSHSRSRGLECLGKGAHALATLANQVSRDLMRSLRRIHARRVGLDEHRQVQARDDGPGVVTLDEGARLVERRASPKVNQEQDLLLVLELAYRLLELGPEVIRTHGGLEAHDRDVLLVTKDHGARLPDARRKLAMTC